MGELEEFCEALYGSSEGYVYSPTKDPNTTDFELHYFAWPNQKDKLYAHIRSSSRRSEVYIAPALLDRRAISKDHFKSTRTVWTEFDGVLPTELDGIPEPSLKIQSSDPGHEHWYWFLEYPCNDLEVIELVNKKIAYTLNADLSAWDAIQVLRPPVTIHHESGKVVSKNGGSSDYVSLKDFAHLEDPSVANIELELGNLPDLQWVIGTYKWPNDEFDLFMKSELPKGIRSSSLVRLAYACSEMGMSNEEIYVVLEYKDSHWKKFTNRSNRYKCLLEIVRYVRSEKQKDQIEEASHTLQALRFEDFLRTEIRLEWILKGVIPVAGQAVLFGEPGCGKTTLALRTAMAVAKGEDYLAWQTLSAKRILFVSAEMPHEELQEFFDQMDLHGSQSALQERLFIYPIGHGFPLNNINNQATIIDLIEKHNIDIVIFDSLSVIAGGSLNSDEVVIKLNDWISKEIRVRRNCAVLHIHHSRKPDKMQGAAEARYLSSLYGSTFIAAPALTVIGMERKSQTSASLHYVKGRYLKEDAHFLLATDNRDFEITEKEAKPNARKTRSNRDSSPDLAQKSGGSNKLFKFGV